MRYCAFCGAEMPEGQDSCPQCGMTKNGQQGKEKREQRTIGSVIWPKGGGSHPAARLLRILAQVTFWCGVVYLLSILGNGLRLDAAFVTVMTCLVGFLPGTGILLGLAEVIELLDRRNSR